MRTIARYAYRARHSARPSIDRITAGLQHANQTLAEIRAFNEQAARGTL